MAVDIKAITCPQCGSTDIKMISETQGKCNSCDAGLVILFNKPIVLAETDESRDYMYGRVQLIPKYSKNEFIRSTLISLVKEDAPIEIFSENIDVTEQEREFVMESISVDFTYQADVQYKSKDSIIPIVTTRTGNESCQSVAIAENIGNTDLREQVMVEALLSSTVKELEKNDTKYSVALIDKEKMEGITLGRTRRCLNMYHTRHIGDYLRKNVEKFLHLGYDAECHEPTYKVSSIKHKLSTLYVVSEYETAVSYGEKEYRKFTLPIGSMEIVGDNIDEKATERIKKEYEDRIWKSCREIKDKDTKTRICISLPPIVLLLFSIINTFSQYGKISTLFPLIIAILCCAAYLYVDKKVINTEVKCSEVEKWKNKERDIEIENYKKKRIDALNEKLCSLGLEPATDSDFCCLSQTEEDKKRMAEILYNMYNSERISSLKFLEDYPDSYESVR